MRGPLHYLIGVDGTPVTSETGVVLEVGYDAGVCPALPGVTYVKYCNLFDERNSGHYGPYLRTSSTAADYHEGQIDPKGPGWFKNLDEQFTRARIQGYHYIELDNPDAYEIDAVLSAIAHAEVMDLQVVAKNPLLCEGNIVSYVAHPNVVGAIVEEGAGTCDAMHDLRTRVARPTLPVWFVSFKKRAWAQARARAIAERGYVEMGVSFSPHGEYESSIDVFTPVVARS